MRRIPTHTLRDVEAMLVPSGEQVVFPQGTWLVVQRALGGQFTVMTDMGGLARIDGKDADALGPELVAEIQKFESERATQNEGPFDEARVWDSLGTVFDPEIPASIVELGLIYGVIAEPVEGGQRVKVQMTLTAPGCGVGPVLIDDVRRALLGTTGVKEAEVELVFDPPWDPSRMSEAARLQLGFM